MNISINKTQKDVADNATLLRVLKDAALAEQKGIAIAVNQEVIQRSNWSNKKLKENDKILIIKATQGG